MARRICANSFLSGGPATIDIPDHPVFIARASENVGPARMWRLAGSDPLELVGTFSVEGDSPEAALENLWVVGNKMDHDLNGQDWPRDRRSQCVADVVDLAPAGAPDNVTRWVCDHVGWVTADVYFAREAARSH